MKKTFLFWNMQGKSREALLADIAAHRHVDVICLAEDGTDLTLLLQSLQDATGNTFFSIKTRTPKLTLLTKDPALGIRQLTFDGHEMLLALAHFQSKLNRKPSEQNSAMQTFADEIRFIENKRNNYKTILFGDLNMNPFDDGIVMSHGLHAVSTKKIAQKRTRIVDGKELPFFYNPMWGFFGDRTDGPPGTIYYRGGRLSFEWSIFDQVMFRPDVLPWFVDEVDIVTTSSGADLKLRSGRPNRRIASDHFPVIFSLEPNSVV